MIPFKFIRGFIYNIVLTSINCNDAIKWITWFDESEHAFNRDLPVQTYEGDMASFFIYFEYYESSTQSPIIVDISREPYPGAMFEEYIIYRTEPLPNFNREIVLIRYVTPWE